MYVEHSNEEQLKKLRRKIWVLSLGAVLLLLAGLGACFYFKWPGYVRYLLAIAAALLFVWSKRAERRVQAELDMLKPQPESPVYTRTGLFRQIWEQYEYYRFAPWLDSQTTVDQLNDYDNMIELWLTRNGCDVCFNFAEDSIYMTANEGTKQNVSKTVPLSEFADLSAVEQALRTFLNENT